MITNKYLWEILVPHHDNAGVSFKVPYHREWDAKVREITGGLTIFKPSKGQWVSGDRVYFDKMIPVRIYCTEKEIDEIIKITLNHYDQEAVFCMRISDLVKIVKR